MGWGWGCPFSLRCPHAQHPTGAAASHFWHGCPDPSGDPLPPVGVCLFVRLWLLIAPLPGSSIPRVKQVAQDCPPPLGVQMQQGEPKMEAFQLRSILYFLTSSPGPP